MLSLSLLSLTAWRHQISVQVHVQPLWGVDLVFPEAIRRHSLQISRYAMPLPAHSSFTVYTFVLGYHFLEIFLSVRLLDRAALAVKSKLYNTCDFLNKNTWTYICWQCDDCCYDQSLCPSICWTSFLCWEITSITAVSSIPTLVLCLSQ